MKLKSFRYVGPQAVKSMAANGWMTVAAVLTITISLFLCTVFWLLLLNLDANAAAVEDDIRVMVYLDTDIQSELQRGAIEEQLENLSGVAALEFIPREEGLAAMEERFDYIDLEATLGGSNPLPDMYALTAVSPQDVAQIAAVSAEIEGVEEVVYGQGTVERLITLTATLRQAGFAVMALLAIAAVVLIALSTRLTIMARRKEIMIMKWVGATNAFIRWPFFLEGLLLGLIGAALALGLVLLTYSNSIDYLRQTISFIELLPLSEIWLQTLCFTLAAGLLLGAIGSLLPLARFLDV